MGAARTSWRIQDDLLLGSLTIINNQIGLSIIAHDTVITATAVTSNLGDGAFVQGTFNTVKGISCSRNGGRGLFVDGDNNLLDGNRCELNGSTAWRSSGTTTS